MLRRAGDRLTPFALFVLRLIVGMVFILRGLPKFSNMAGTAGFFGSLGIPAPELMAPFIAVLEVVGGLALVLGIATRWVSLLFILEMIVTTLLVKLPRLGIVAPANQPGVGAELDLLLMAGALILVALGVGSLSVEQGVLKREL